MDKIYEFKIWGASKRFMGNFQNARLMLSKCMSHSSGKSTPLFGVWWCCGKTGIY